MGKYKGSTRSLELLRRRSSAIFSMQVHYRRSIPAILILVPTEAIMVQHVEMASGL